MVTPYITFNGSCSKALEYYQNVFKSEVSMCQQYGEYIPEGVDTPPETLSSWILHAEIEICGTKFWFADDVNPVSKGNIVRLTTTVPTAEEAREIFDLLSDEGYISLPPVETFYSTFHAALTDKFGVNWNIVAEEQPIKT